MASIYGFLSPYFYLDVWPCIFFLAVHPFTEQPSGWWHGNRKNKISIRLDVLKNLMYNGKIWWWKLENNGFPVNFLGKVTWLNCAETKALQDLG